MPILRWRCVPSVTSSACQHGGLFSMAFSYIVNFKGKFLCVDKTLVADITIKIIRKLCCFRKMDKIYMLVSHSLIKQIHTYIRDSSLITLIAANSSVERTAAWKYQQYTNLSN